MPPEARIAGDRDDFFRARRCEPRLNALSGFFEHRREQQRVGLADQLLQLSIAERVDLRRRAKDQSMIGQALIEIMRGLREIARVALGGDHNQRRRGQLGGEAGKDEEE